MKKKTGEMTFKEFFEEIRKEGRDNQEVEDIKNWMLDFLRGEGFTDEQINKMKMKEVQKFTSNIRP